MRDQSIISYVIVYGIFFSSENLFVFPEVFSCLVFHVLSTMNPKLRHWLFYQFPLLIEFLLEHFFCSHLDWSTPQHNFRTVSWRTPLSLSCVGSSYTTAFLSSVLRFSFLGFTKAFNINLLAIFKHPIMFFLSYFSSFL